MYSTKAKGVRYLNTAEGYVTQLALDENGEVIGYTYVAIAKMMAAIRDGGNPAKALEDNTRKYGRFDEGVKFIDPRKE